MFNSLINISKKTELIFVSDFFVSDLIGGAELTHEAILSKCPFVFETVKSSNVTPKLVEDNKNKYWILGNISQISKESLVEIATTTKFSRIECDYLYCKFRSSHLHALKTGEECKCQTTEYGRFVKGLFKRAHRVFFMSEGQLNEYKRVFPVMKNWGDKLVVQGSTFAAETLEHLNTVGNASDDEIRQALIDLGEDPDHDEKSYTYQDAKIGETVNAKFRYKNKKDTWVVVAGSWIKNQQETEQYCKDNNIKYDLIGGVTPYNMFLKVLSQYKGLIFHPKGFDTNPRLTIEAKLLGLELDLNENVQQRGEEWFEGSREDCLKHLEGLPEKFWKEVL